MNIRVVTAATVAILAIAASILPGVVAAADSNPAAVFPGGLYVPHSSAALQAAAAQQQSGNTAGAQIDTQLAAQPTAVWLGDWLTNAQLAATVGTVLAQAQSDGTTPVFVTYAIPNRDCGGYSAGGLTPTQYASWNKTLAFSLSGSTAVVIVEPDALAQLTQCPQDTAARERILYNSMKQLAAFGVTLYLDAGNSTWIAPAVMAKRLWASGLEFARGFSSNVSNFYPVAQEQVYDNQLRAITGRHYVIDVSRNGRGSNGEWCNPTTAGLGQNPRVVLDDPGLDALLWIKTPGQSDGPCNGGPAAGQWFQSGAEALYNNR